jgi:hypothetical protein
MRDTLATGGNTAMKTNDKAIRTLARKAFPDYKGRRFFTEVQTRPLDLRSSWCEGSRDYFTFVRLSDGQVCEMPAQSAFDPKIRGMESFWMPQGFVCVRRSIFTGNDCGLTVITAGNAPLIENRIPKLEGK